VSAPPPCVYSLTGFPGTGKLTVATELVRALDESGRPAKLVDNHSTADPILRVLPIDGATRVDPEVWMRVQAVRNVVFDTIATMSPPEWSFVFTNYVSDLEADRAAYRDLEDIATRRGVPFVPVRLTVEPDELLRRIRDPSRTTAKKLTDVDLARELFVGRDLFRPSHANLLDLDITDVAPADAAARIVAHVRA
jgi:hypothetical protein